MSKSETFDLSSSPLQGVNMIEAGAGTGKTFTITGLFLRLILERDLTVQQILVVTFTEAATAELKDRIRRRLREALEDFERGGSNDELIGSLIRKFPDARPKSAALREAVRAFDKAAVFTIHGFCRRVLQENAFESGMLFDTDLVTDQEELKRGIAEDFWRKHFYETSPMFVAYALRNGFSPDYFVDLLSHWVTLPGLKVIPPCALPDGRAEEENYGEAFKRVRRMWPAAREEVAAALAGGDALKKNMYPKEKIPVWINAMDAWLASGPDSVLFSGFEKFTRRGLAKAVKKNCSTPDHPFFHAADTLLNFHLALEEGYRKRLLALKVMLFSYARRELERRKHHQNIRSFDDLLTDLEAALEGEGGRRLKRLLGLKYKAALIDEFQDTDQVQYTIFKKIFAETPNGLFLIGDPKQAIYGFRGADIFTYMEASESTDMRYTLRENWRSEPALIRAVNTLFSHRDHPFIFEGIPFEPAVPARIKDRALLRLKGREEPPFQLWFLDARKTMPTGKPVTKQKARELIPGAVAAEISRLIRLGHEKKALIGDRPLTAGDIAVLVRKNREALLVQKALSALHIPSVLYAGDNLFDSIEALETERVLKAIADPNNVSRLKAALVTDLLGRPGEALEGAIADGVSWEAWVVRFREYHDLWRRRGFIQMFRQFLSREEVLGRLMSYENGERRSTNLLHLSEVLHQEFLKKRSDISVLLKWFSEQRDDSRAGRVVHPLRLESDANAVKLVTTHKSKGLEYPIVFCPFQWDGSTIGPSDKSFVFHERERGTRLVLDLGSEETAANRALAEEEILAENLRLLYVALTRSRCRCYLVWGRFNEGETSAPAYLLHPADSIADKDVVGATREHFKGLSDEDLVKMLRDIEKKSGGAICFRKLGGEAPVVYTPVDIGRPALTPRVFSGRIDRTRGVSSFSSLTAARIHEEDATDRDAMGWGEVRGEVEETEDINRSSVPDIFSFPGGTKAGTFFHELFEDADYADPMGSCTEMLVLEKLRTYGYEDRWHGTVCDMMKKVLCAPLQNEKGELRLCNIRQEDRLNELEFTFPLKPVTPEGLQALFQDAAGQDLPGIIPETIGRLDFEPKRGFMKGFMDLVFLQDGRYYLVDWKSNVLGKRIEDYDPKGMSRAMKDGLYTFQYLIYTLALDQYLRLRLTGYNYDRHFGGVYYIFIRGVEPERGPEYGIYPARPAAGVIQKLREYMMEERSLPTTSS